MLDHHYIGTEHILLGLIREGDGVAAQAAIDRQDSQAATALRGKEKQLLADRAAEPDYGSSSSVA